MIPKFCFRHYWLNCPLCFPASMTGSSAPTSKSRGNQNSLQKQQQSIGSTNSKQNAPKTVSAGTSMSSIDGISATATNTITAITRTTGISATTTVAAVIPTTGISAPTNNVVGSSLAQGSKVVATVASPPSEATKRKTEVVPKKRRKRLRKTVIDDDVACEIFRSLRLPIEFLNSGKVLAWAVQPDDPAFVNIHNYVAASQEHGFGVKIISILRIIVKTDDVDIVPFSDDPSVKGQNRMMLWHGTKSRVLSSILQDGLKLPNSHGQMFGPGIYFADRVSKSCQYCGDQGQLGMQSAGYIGYLFLCDVLLGNMYKAYKSFHSDMHCYPKSPPTGYDSIKGCGSNVPAPEWNQTIDGCVWPIGPTVRNKEGDSGNCVLIYNEYIVFKTTQAQPKYLVKVEFTRKPVAEILY